MSDAANRWTEFYTKSTEMMYPAEAVIRIFKGSYPNLKMPKPKAGDSILDVGCGDGRHFPLFHSLGLKIAGSEITHTILGDILRRLNGLGPLNLAVGTCASLPWIDAAFDYLLTWNSCYYMEPDGKFEDHVAEMARVLKPGGWIVCSVPKTSHEIFTDAVFSANGYCIIKGDRFGLRNGETFHWFDDADALAAAFSSHFTDFCYASIEDVMFGHNYHWHVIVARRT